MVTSVLYKDVAASLPHVDDVLPYNEGDHAVMAELKAVLAKHNMQSRFGVTLLHDHFPIAEDEVMVEVEDPENRTLITKPVKFSELQDDSIVLMETQWRLDNPHVLTTAMKECKKDRFGNHFTIQN